MTTYSPEEREIRRERRERKRAEVDARRALRLRRHGKGQPIKNLYAETGKALKGTGAQAPSCWLCGSEMVTDTMKINGADGQPRAAFICDACRPMAREIEQAAAEDGSMPDSIKLELAKKIFPGEVGENAKMVENVIGQGPDGPDQLKLF